jgi:hypothetical protein
MARPEGLEPPAYGFEDRTFELLDFLIYQQLTGFTKNLDSMIFRLLAHFSRFWKDFLTQILTRLKPSPS